MNAAVDVMPLRPMDQFELDYAAQMRRAKLGWLIASVIFFVLFVITTTLCVVQSNVG